MKSISKLKQIEPGVYAEKFRQEYAALLYRKGAKWYGYIFHEGILFAEMMPQSSFKKADQNLYQELSKIQVEEINLMSRKPFMESLMREYYCSPSSESYWSS